jgi:TolA-binding protein
MYNIQHRLRGLYSTIDYYPFGMEMPGRIKGDTSYRFGFNGQMQDNEFAGKDGAHTTAMYWEYDSRIGRRWNLDPKPQISISDYACFANNPILYSDVLGDKFKNPRQEKRAEKQTVKMRNTANDINTEIDAIKNKTRLTNTDNKNLSDLQSRLDDVNTGIDELQKMKTDNNTYDWKRSIQFAFNDGGWTDPSKNGIIKIRTGWATESGAHELSHAYDYAYSPQMLDVESEIKAYKRSYSVNPEALQTQGWVEFKSYSKITIQTFITICKRQQKLNPMADFYNAALEEWELHQKAKFVPPKNVEDEIIE